MLRASSRFSIREWSRMQTQANLMSTSFSFYSAWSFRSVLEVKLAKLKFLNKNAHWITVAMLSKGKPFWMLGKLMTVPLFVKAESLWLVYRSKNAKTACWLKHVWSYVESPFLWRSCLFKQCNDKYILHVLLRQQTIQNMTQFLVFDLLRCFLCAVFN